MKSNGQRKKKKQAGLSWATLDIAAAAYVGTAAAYVGTAAAYNGTAAAYVGTAAAYGLRWSIIMPLCGPTLQVRTFKISVGLTFQDRVECGNK